jgi:hypothetical protein
MNWLLSGATAVVAGAAFALAVPTEANADALWESMAYSPSTNAFGFGTGPTRQAAQDAAYNLCSATAGDCQAGDTQLGCQAVVTNSQNWAMGDGATRDAAIQTANHNLAGAPGRVVSAQCAQGG